MRLQLLLAAAAAAVLGTSLAAHADTISTYSVNATAADGNKATGTIQVDDNSNTISSVDIDANGDMLTTIVTQNYTAPGDFGGVFGPDQATFSLFTNLGVFDLSGPNDSYAGSATLTGTTTSSVTPEPASIALLGTGLLGTIGVIRRRLA